MPEDKGNPRQFPRNQNRAKNGYRGAITEKEHYIYLGIILDMLIDDLLPSYIPGIVFGQGVAIMSETDKCAAFNELIIPGWENNKANTDLVLIRCQMLF